LIYVIPDTQVKPGVKNPLIPIAHHICDIKPRYVIHGGDHWDFPSLSRYDKGKKSHRTKSYLKDMRAGNKAMDEFWDILNKKWAKHQEECEFILHQGNHEERRVRAIQYGPDELLELIEECDYNHKGWNKVVKFLEVNIVEGIHFTHYFANLNSAYPIGSAAQLIKKKLSSCLAFHKQGFDYAEQTAEEGRLIQCMIVGSCYFHDENYKNHNNHHWRGVVVLTNVRNGMYDFARYSLTELERYYEG